MQRDHVRAPVATSNDPVPLLICRVVFTCCDSAIRQCLANLVIIFRMPFSCFGSVAWPLAAVWELAWAPRSRTCDRSYVKRLHLVEAILPRVFTLLLCSSAECSSPDEALCAAGAGGATTAKKSGFRLKYATEPPSTAIKNL
jgi:hypothetical protein